MADYEYDVDGLGNYSFIFDEMPDALRLPDEEPSESTPKIIGVWIQKTKFYIECSGDPTFERLKNICRKVDMALQVIPDAENKKQFVIEDFTFTRSDS